MLPCCLYKGDLKVNKNVDISKWTIKTIMDLPKEENDNIEFKGGLIKPEVLSKRLSVAASAFSNAAGGLLIVGISIE
jgi:predicted HTH transcriptional regulator